MSAPNYNPEMQAIADAMRGEKKRGLSLAQQWMIAGPLTVFFILVIIGAFSGKKTDDTDPVEVAAVEVPAVDGGYLKKPTVVPRPGDRCTYTALRVTSDIGGIARSLGMQSCPTAGVGYTQQKFDCKNGRRWVEQYGETIASMNARSASSRWESLVPGSSASLMGAFACQKAGLKLIVAE